MSLYCGHAVAADVRCVLPAGHPGPCTDDGAPASGGVSDPAAASGPPLPRYRPRLIASCPDCGTDLVDEAFAFWCPACRQSVSFAQVAYFDEGQPDD